MRRFALILAIWPGLLAAGEFRALSGPEILSALTGQTLDYGDGVWQTFEASMQTQYFSGEPRAGRWAVRDDRYCSLWPPSDLWACYDIQQSDQTIRFIDDAGNATDGVFAE